MKNVTGPFRAVAVVTAAGSAERFGGRKLLAQVDGEPLLDRTVRSLLDGGVSQVIVVVGKDDRAVIERDVNAMNDARVWPVENAEPERGMFSSIQEGVREVSGDALVVLPGDMPYVKPETVQLILDTWQLRHGIVSPKFRGKRGHPVALPLGYRDEILATPATATLHEVIKKHQDERFDLEVDDPGVLRDVDVPDDLARPV